jgi:REP element-mobilizing transposase RayT
MSDPIYTSTNCRVAYQLHWSATLFAEVDWPPMETWRRPLEQSIERDGIRLLEFRNIDARTGQFFVSTAPAVAPAAVARSLKGRLQYLLREKVPRFWRRHYSITSVGDAHNDALQGYVARQVQRHPMADPRIIDRLTDLQFHDPQVALDEPRSSGHARFTHNLHLVFETAEHLHDVREEWLQTNRSRFVATCRHKDWHLSRLAQVSNHMHALLGCDITEPPREIALSLLNNLAHAHGMKPVFAYSFYVGTFGNYDHNAIRMKLED